MAGRGQGNGRPKMLQREVIKNDLAILRLIGDLVDRTWVSIGLFGELGLRWKCMMISIQFNVLGC